MFVKSLLKRLLKFLLKNSSDYQPDTIKSNEIAKELEKEIEDLEEKIDRKLSHQKAKTFKNTTVCGKSVFELEKLRAAMRAVEARINENSIFLMILPIIISIYALSIIEFNIDSNNKAISMFLLILLVLGIFLLLDKVYRKRAEHNTHLIELMDLLIERKNEIKKTYENQ